MSTHDTPNRAAWLEAVEGFAVRASDAPLALAALGARHHDDAAHNASVLSELARVSSESSEAVIANGKRTATGVPIDRCVRGGAVRGGVASVGGPGVMTIFCTSFAHEFKMPQKTQSLSAHGSGFQSAFRRGVAPASDARSLH